MRVAVSAKSPSETDTTLQIGCRSLAEVPAPAMRSGVARVRCQLAEVTLPASITLTLSGAPLTWRALRLELRR